MDNCYLPIVSCERIIDACYYDGELRSVSYPHWRNTACVCLAWIDRSRYNLLHKVELNKESHVDLLLQTLKMHPSLAKFGLHTSTASFSRCRRVCPVRPQTPPRIAEELYHIDIDRHSLGAVSTPSGCRYLATILAVAHHKTRDHHLSGPLLRHHAFHLLPIFVAAVEFGLGRERESLYSLMSPCDAAEGAGMRSTGGLQARRMCCVTYNV